MIFKDICRFGLLSAFQKYIINLCTMKNKAVRVFLLGEGRIFEIFLSRGRLKRVGLTGFGQICQSKSMILLKFLLKLSSLVKNMKNDIHHEGLLKLKFQWFLSVLTGFGQICQIKSMVLSKFHLELSSMVKNMKNDIHHEGLCKTLV